MVAEISICSSLVEDFFQIIHNMQKIVLSMPLESKALVICLLYNWQLILFSELHNLMEQWHAQQWLWLQNFQIDYCIYQVMIRYVAIA